jgi:glutathione S-transferase
MKLHYALSSPYVRNVMLVAHECGLVDQLELLPTTPQTIIEDVSTVNPLGQIPTLITDHDTVIYDSSVIMEYLDHLSGGGLLPLPGPARWEVLRLQATGNGIITAVNLRYNELRRPEGEQSPAWILKKDKELERTLDALETIARKGDLSSGPDMGTLTIACALAYTGLRWAEGAWQASRPELAKWFNDFEKRPSMQMTKP